MFLSLSSRYTFEPDQWRKEAPFTNLMDGIQFFLCLSFGNVGSRTHGRGTLSFNFLIFFLKISTLLLDSSNKLTGETQ